MVRWTVLLVAGLMVMVPGASAGAGHAHTHDVALQEEMIQQWMRNMQLSTPEQAEQLVEDLGYPIPADPEERFVDYVVREDLTTAGSLDGAQRVMRFVHVTDLQLIDDDAPTPMRVGVFDEVFAATISGGGERPQEEYADEIMHSLVDVINAHHAIDPLDFAIHTGDNIDNALENELMRYIDLVEGTHTTTGPVSGKECKPDGQSESTEDSSNDVTDSCTSLPDHVVPHLRGLASDLPWYSLFGNHDGLIQGNVPVEPSFQELAGGFGRYFLRGHEYVDMHFEGLDSCAGGSAADDFGHGFGFADETRRCDSNVENDAYYAFDHQGLRFIILDTVNDEVQQGNEHTGGTAPDESTTGYDMVSGLSQGAIDNLQWEWLQGELDAAADLPVILAAHHTISAFYSDTLDAACDPGGNGCLEDGLRAAGFRGRDDMMQLIGQYPNVVAFIGGHTHRHDVNAEVGGLYGDHPGYWNIETSGMLDLPQESRIVEMWVTEDGAKAFFALDPIGHQFQLAKDLAATDPDEDAVANTGDADDRRALLWFDVPAGQPLLGPQPPGSLPDNITLHLVEPENHHGEGPIHLHETGLQNITVHLSDEDGEDLEEFTVQFGVTNFEAFEGEEEFSVIQVFEPMDEEEGGVYRTEHEFGMEGFYTIGFNVLGPEGDDMGTLYFDIQVGDEEKDTPIAAVPLMMLGLVLVAALRRRG